MQDFRFGKPRSLKIMLFADQRNLFGLFLRFFWPYLPALTAEQKKDQPTTSTPDCRPQS